MRAGRPRAVVHRTRAGDIPTGSCGHREGQVGDVVPEIGPQHLFGTLDCRREVARIHRVERVVRPELGGLRVDVDRAAAFLERTREVQRVEVRQGEVVSSGEIGRVLRDQLAVVLDRLVIIPRDVHEVGAECPVLLPVGHAIHQR